MLKERKILTGVIFFAAAVVLCGGFSFFRGRRYHMLNSVSGMDTLSSDDLRPDSFGTDRENVSGDAKYVEGEVVCNVGSEEEAKRVADAVNGRLKSWQEGIAVIAIEEDVNNFLKKYSDAPDLPAMYPNYIYSIKY